MEEDLQKAILQESDPKRAEQLMALARFNIKKQNVVRNQQVSALQDRIMQQLAERIEKRPNQFSNKELLDYFSSMNTILSQAEQSEEESDIPIVINNNVLVQTEQQKIEQESAEKLGVESRKNIAQAVNQILRLKQKEQEEGEVNEQ